MNLEAEEKNMQKIHHILNLGGGRGKKKGNYFYST